MGVRFNSFIGRDDLIIMVFRVICLIFHIVDMILYAIDLTRGFIVSHCKNLAGATDDPGGSNSTPAVMMYLAMIYYIYISCSSSGEDVKVDRGHQVRDGITDWGQYPR